MSDEKKWPIAISANYFFCDDCRHLHIELKNAKGEIFAETVIDAEDAVDIADFIFETLIEPDEEDLAEGLVVPGNRTKH